MIRYVFREDRPLAIKNAKDADPQLIGAALDEISRKHGGALTPNAVVETARNNRSVLHKHFDWDDKVAGEKWRLEQARGLVASIHVEAAETETGYSRAFLSIQDRDGRSYRTVSDVMKSVDLQAKVLAAAERDLLAFERRYRSLGEICELIRGVREQIAKRANPKEIQPSA